MTIYFACASAYNFLVSYILVKTTYKNVKARTVLFLQDHIDSLHDIEKNLSNMKLFDEIVFVKMDSTIEQQMKPYFPQFDDKVHLFALDPLNEILYNNSGDGVKLIVTEERFFSLKHPNLFNEVEDINIPSKLLFEKAHELMVFDPNYVDSSIKLPVVQIPFLEILQNEESRLDIVDGIKKIYNIGSIPSCDSEVIFFDQWLSSGGIISFEAENYILTSLDALFTKYNIAIKKHPGENEKIKYCNLHAAFLDSSKIPWEAWLTLQCTSGFLQKRKIFITYNSTSVLNEKIIFQDDNCYLIFLSKILDRYMINPVDEFFINRYLEIYPKANIFFPESFVELDELLSNILRNENYHPDHVNQLVLEQANEIEWLRSCQLDLCKNMPPICNLTSMVFSNDDGTEYTSSVNFPVAQQSLTAMEFSFKFGIPHQSTRRITKALWCAVHGRNVGIKLERIVIEDCNNTEHMLNLEGIVYPGVPNADGYILCDDFYPCFTIPIQSHIKTVTVDGSWIFDNSYVEAVFKANRLTQKVSKISEKLLLDIDERDRVFKAVVSERDAISEALTSSQKQAMQLLLDIDERDRAFEAVVSERDAISDTLTSSQNQAMQLILDIGEKDDMIKKISDENITLIAQNTDLRGKYNQVTGSLSWKMTKPLRYVLKLFNKN